MVSFTILCSIARVNALTAALDSPSFGERNWASRSEIRIGVSYLLNHNEELFVEIRAWVPLLCYFDSLLF